MPPQHTRTIYTFDTTSVYTDIRPNSSYHPDDVFCWKESGAVIRLFGGRGGKPPFQGECASTNKTREDSFYDQMKGRFSITVVNYWRLNVRKGHTGP